MEKIDEQAVLEALSDAVLEAAAEDDASFRDLIKAAGRELKRRFEEDPASLPGTFVIKLYLDGQKALAAGAAPEEKTDELTVLEIVESAAISVERKRQLLEDEKARLIAEHARVEEALRGLV